METPRSSPITRQLRAYEEGWREDHDQAMQFWNFQENLTVGIAIFKMIARRCQDWRWRVSQGEEPFRAEDDAAIRSQFQWWLSPCDRAMAQLQHFEGLYGAVAGGEDFRRRCQEARQILDTWTPPVLSQATGLHRTEFDAAAAQQLAGILESGQARLKVQPRRITQTGA